MIGEIWNMSPERSFFTGRWHCDQAQNKNKWINLYRQIHKHMHGWIYKHLENRWIGEFPFHAVSFVVLFFLWIKPI